MKQMQQNHIHIRIIVSCAVHMKNAFSKFTISFQADKFCTGGSAIFHPQMNLWAEEMISKNQRYKIAINVLQLYASLYLSATDGSQKGSSDAGKRWLFSAG